MNELKILVLDDEKRLRDEIGEYLRKRKHEVFLASKPSEAFAVIQQEDIDIAVVDIRLPEMSGLEVLKEIKRISQQIEVIMISGHGDMDSVIEAMRNDAFDYFQKPFRMMEMQKSIERTEKFVELNKRLKHKDNTITTLTEKLYESMGSPMIGQTTAIRQVINLMERVAASPHTNVLITGESGTGKELVAHGIHLLSERRKTFFIRSTVLPSLTVFLKVNFSVIRRAHSQELSKTGRAPLSMPQKERCFWMRLAICRWASRQSCSEHSKTEKCIRWAEGHPSRWMFV